MLIFENVYEYISLFPNIIFCLLILFDSQFNVTESGISPTPAIETMIESPPITFKSPVIDTKEKGNGTGNSMFGLNNLIAAGYKELLLLPNDMKKRVIIIITVFINLSETLFFIDSEGIESNFFCILSIACWINDLSSDP